MSPLIDVKSVFYSSPLIYSLLLLLSIASMGIWLYSLIAFRRKEIMPKGFSKELRSLLEQGNFDQAYKLCTIRENLLSHLVKTGLSNRNLTPEVMIDVMKSEGKKSSTAFWQRLSLLNDIVIISPMIGLLGTVIGMFYAFYDVNRSVESINALFDGLGIAVGTTVAGLLVAILSMIFHTTLKYRLVKLLSNVENEAFHLSTLLRR